MIPAALHVDDRMIPAATVVATLVVLLAAGSPCVRFTSRVVVYRHSVGVINTSIPAGDIPISAHARMMP